LTYESPILT
jgi:hypothetical protein